MPYGESISLLERLLGRRRAIRCGHTVARARVTLCVATVLVWRSVPLHTLQHMACGKCPEMGPTNRILMALSSSLGVELCFCWRCRRFCNRQKGLTYRCWINLLNTATVIEQYHDEHGAWPSSLDEEPFRSLGTWQISMGILWCTAGSPVVGGIFAVLGGNGKEELFFWIGT